ncbi:MAG: hypothetical protein ACI9TY_000569 [Alphaproteobacteria bacterium]|jgi:hypothetical protein
MSTHNKILNIFIYVLAPVFVIAIFAVLIIEASNDPFNANVTITEKISENSSNSVLLAGKIPVTKFNPATWYFDINHNGKSARCETDIATFNQKTTGETINVKLVEGKISGKLMCLEIN